MEKIDILLVDPGKVPKMVQIDNTLAAMQGMVGGCVEMTRPWGGDVVLVCNEEGKVQNLPANSFVSNEDGVVLDLIYGSFFLALAPRNSELMMSLPRMMAEHYGAYLMPVVCKLED